MVKSYSEYKSTYEYTKTKLSSTQDELDDLEDEYYDLVESEYNGVIDKDWKNNDKVTGIVFNIERLKQELDQLDDDYTNAKE